MPLLGRNLITPEMAQRPSAEDDVIRVKMLDEIVFLVMQELGPAYRDRRKFFPPSVLTTPEKDRPNYHHPSQPHHYKIEALLKRDIGGRAVGLSLQEKEMVGMDEEGNPRMLPVGEPGLKVVTTGRGGIDLPGESAYLFTPSYHVQIRQNALHTLKLFVPKGEEVVHQVFEEHTNGLYDQLMDLGQ